MRIGLWKRGWGGGEHTDWRNATQNQPYRLVRGLTVWRGASLRVHAIWSSVCLILTPPFLTKLYTFLSSVAFSVSNKFAEFLMIGSFWNLCRTCPSMPVDKVRTPQCFEASTWSILLFFVDMSASDTFYCCGWTVVCYGRKMKCLIRQCAVSILTVMYGLTNN